MDASQAPLFEPGREYHVVTDNKTIGTRSFNVYVPRDYTDDRDWPVIFRYGGQGDKYSPIICREGRSATCDRGAIVIGMGCIESGRKNVTPIEYRRSVLDELRSITEAKRLVAKYIRIDNNRLFLSGTSAGGWLATKLLELKADEWAGAIVYVAGRHPNADLLTNRKSTRAFYGLPVFFGSALPGDSHGGNYQWAVRGTEIYERRGAIVTFQTYQKGKWLTCSPLLRDWVRAYVLDGKDDSAADKFMKWRQLTRKMPEEIDSAEIIKKQISQNVGQSPDQLTNADLIKVEELSLMGQYVSDISYLTHLDNLRSLDISFTYVDTVGPLLRCKNLRKLDISDTHIKDITPLKNLPNLETLRMWNLWLDRSQVDELKESLPNLDVVDYQWDLYEKDSIDRVVPKLRIKLN
ncbi:MAG: leucine-rich repeat domain-containing protein [Sedimentisphaerales bacterium]|nr:leucine-rich repeat domain-containing protein [Sedimentisphaerales bacterium]